MLRKLDYAAVRQFARSALEHVNETMPDTTEIAMTLHGVSIGLDERETFLSQLSGLEDGLRAGLLPKLSSVLFIEVNAKRAGRLSDLLKLHAPQFTAEDIEAVQPHIAPSESVLTVAPLNRRSMVEKPHVFVAMPFTEEMEDVFIFGIQAPVQNAGFLCERVDLGVFSGDILERIKSRIESAALVVADLTGANANVYLEVGYAWGKNKQTVLLCKNINDLKFDVRGQRCLIYSSINDLHKKLTEELRIRVTVG